MNLDKYQNRTFHTAVYPRDNRIMALSYVILGLASEAGEVAGKVKKFIRDGQMDDQATADELGDVLWYVARVADELGYDLSEIAQRNLDKLEDRKTRGVLKGSGDKR
jgi:NTP pyrophosphatase (non-canonical NTP hydrolase)